MFIGGGVVIIKGTGLMVILLNDWKTCCRMCAAKTISDTNMLG